MGDDDDGITFYYTDNSQARKIKKKNIKIIFYICSYVHISYIYFTFWQTPSSTQQIRWKFLSRNSNNIWVNCIFMAYERLKIFSFSILILAKQKWKTFRSFLRSFVDRQNDTREFLTLFSKKHKRISNMSVSAILWIGHTWVGADGGYLPVEVDAMLVGMTCLFFWEE